MIVPADDEVEPIIAFTPADHYEASMDDPLGALVMQDVPTRIAAAQKLQTTFRRGPKAPPQTSLQKRAREARSKWQNLQAAADGDIGVLGVSTVSDVRVPPLTQSTWSQTNIGDYTNWPTCYNYYTPNNYPCGCVATAMAQLMRYHEYPTAGIGSPYMGGNGYGGPYVWEDMILEPYQTMPLYQRQAIGALCYDAAESVDTIYGSGGSSASLYDADQELVNTFDYSNCIHGYNNYNDIGSGLEGMINSNLDAALPVILGIKGGSGGHALVCDGYGYQSTTLYHHLNMGWSGRDNVWYNLPIIDCSETGYSFNAVHTCLYNVYKSGSGEIISGRITDPAGGPIADVNVAATAGITCNGLSNENGIYAVTNVPSSTTFTVSPSKSPWQFAPQPVTTGYSTGGLGVHKTSGNVCGIDFTGTISAGFIEFDEDTCAAGETVGVKIVDTDLLGTGSVAAVLTTCGGDTETVSLAETPVDTGVFIADVDTAQSSPVPENGTIELQQSSVLIGTYQDADDGTGAPATASNTCTLNVLETLCEADFTGGLPAGWQVINGGTSNDTWTSANPGGRSSSYWDGTFMIVDSDYTGYEDMDEQLLTPAIDCTSYSGVELQFSHYFQYYGNEIADLDVSVASGPWQSLRRWQGETIGGVVEVDLSAIADGQPDVQIRWHYYNANWEYYWGIDNVQIRGSIEPTLPTGDFEPDCDVDFSDYAIIGAAWHSDPNAVHWNPACDISVPPDSAVNLKDLLIFSDNWLNSVGP